MTRISEAASGTVRVHQTRRSSAIAELVGDLILQQQAVQPVLFQEMLTANSRRKWCIM
jgi:hypothetical protein